MFSYNWKNLRDPIQQTLTAIEFSQRIAYYYIYYLYYIYTIFIRISLQMIHHHYRLQLIGGWRTNPREHRTGQVQVLAQLDTGGRQVENGRKPPFRWLMKEAETRVNRMRTWRCVMRFPPSSRLCGPSVCCHTFGIGRYGMSLYFQV